MKTKNGEVTEETFFLGKSRVTIVNPNSYFPSELTDDTIKNFSSENEDIFINNYNELAAASRDFYKYEHTLDLQRETITKYLDTTSNKVVMEEVGLSNKVVSELKHKNSDLKSMTIDTFERLYQTAAKKINTIE